MVSRKSQLSPENFRFLLRRLRHLAGATCPALVGKVKVYGSKDGCSAHGSSMSISGGLISSQRCNRRCRKGVRPTSFRSPQFCRTAFVPCSREPSTTSFSTNDSTAFCEGEYRSS